MAGRFTAHGAGRPQTGKLLVERDANRVKFRSECSKMRDVKPKIRSASFGLTPSVSDDTAGGSLEHGMTLAGAGCGLSERQMSLKESIESAAAQWKS